MEGFLGVPLKKIKISNFKPDLCIICQKKKKDKVTSTENGRQKIIDAANVKKGEVYERLHNVTGTFVYHMNYLCYKRFVHHEEPQSQDKETENSDTESRNAPPLASPRTRLHSTPRDPCATNVDIYKSHCAVCGNAKHKGVYEKSRIEQDERAKKFLKATVFFQDEVYMRTCDLQDIYSVFGADLFCHKNCIKNYLLKYERALEKISGPEKGNLSEKEIVFNDIIAKLDVDLKKGIGYPLSYLRDLCNQLLVGTLNTNFTNRELKLFLVNFYGDKITFSHAHILNQSALVFLNDISKEDIAETVRNYNPVREIAETFRDILLQEPDPLHDKFCDAKDLEDAFNNMKIPEPILEFLCILYNVDQNHFYTKIDNQSSEHSFPIRKRQRIMALYQKMFYDVNNGQKKTPFHIINSEMIYDTCRSKLLITGLNHMGLGISYQELRRYHNDLASFVLSQSSDDVPLPSHFEKDVHTVAAFDNFDHNEHTPSGLNSSHDTVSILIQDKPETMKRKPNISETAVQHGSKKIIGPLPCQNLHEYENYSKRIEIPNDYGASSDFFEMAESDYEDIKKTDFAWDLSRLDLSNISNEIINPFSEDQLMPSWYSFNSVISERKLEVQQIGFLPVLPYPVTQYNTVYTSLKNFKNILSQLTQNEMAVFCDEGVYHIAREILLKRPTEFKGIVLCLGSFHMIKTVLACIGKYIAGSGCRSIWTENKVFGIDVVESVLSGKDYERSIDGIFLLAESISRSQWTEFLNRNVSKYSNELKVLSALKAAVSKKQKNLSRNLLNEFKSISSQMIDAFDRFKKEKSELSQTFHYWDNFLAMAHRLKNLLRADREGNWNLHLQAVKDVMPLFCVFDRTNYIRWCSLYLEDMQKLATTAPDVYNAFLAGKFSVKETPGEFNGTATDMRLEQSINRSSKGKGGIIGATQRKDFVSMWNLTYHERLAVNNLGRKLNGTDTNYDENRVHHEFSKAETDRQEGNIQRMIQFLQTKENPVRVTETTESKLHHIINQEILPDDVSSDLVKMFEIGESLYTGFRQTRFIEKTVKLSETIHRRNLKTFETSNARNKNQKSGNAAKTSKKEIVQAQKLIDLARVRHFDVKDLFRYNLVSTSYLFEDDGLMKTTSKSQLVKELEKYLNAEDYKDPMSSSMKTAYLVDVMSCLRKLTIKPNSSFGALCQDFINYTFRLCRNAAEIHFVFDSYKNGSVKDSERSRRYERTPVDINIMKNDTPLPLDMSTFWASNTNKVKLEKLLRENIINASKNLTELQILSAFSLDDEATSCIKLHPQTALTDLDIVIEEADLRLLPHAKYAIENNNSERVIILANDTDIVVAFLYHSSTLECHGMKELWIRGGVGDTTRYIPLHTLAKNLGVSICEKLPAMHSLTGHDANSKFGTKLSGLKQIGNFKLEGFGKDPRVNSVDQMIVEAEKYLVKVLKSNSLAKNMDEPRYEIYHHSKTCCFIDLPPTSSETQKHCLRALFNTYPYLYAMVSNEMPYLEPSDYGYELSDGLLIPSRCSVKFPENLVLPCTCQACATKKCLCKSNGINCCEYCNCQGRASECRNKTGINL